MERKRYYGERESEGQRERTENENGHFNIFCACNFVTV